MELLSNNVDFTNRIFLTLENENNELFERIKKFYYVIESYLKLEKKSDNKGMTNHGILHINNLLYNINTFLERDIISLSSKSMYYLLIATIIHDLGMTNLEVPRQSHHLALKSILYNIRTKNEEYETIMSEEEDKIVCDIASTHSGDAIESYKKILELYQHTNEEIVLASIILRISDELEITQERVKNIPFSAIINQLTSENLKHWFFHKAIQRWQFNETDLCIIEIIYNENIENYISEKMRGKDIDFSINDFISFNKNKFKKITSEINSINEIMQHSIKSKNRWRNYTLKIVPISKPNLLIDDFNNTMMDPMEEEYNRKQYNYIDMKQQEERVGKEISKAVTKKIAIKKYSEKKINKYYLIGDIKLRDKINDYIKEQSMLISGHFKHHSLRMLDWLDTYRLYYNYELVQECCNTIHDMMTTIGIDGLIGINFKGAKLASIISAQNSLPFIIYINGKLNNKDDFLLNCKNIGIITDCVITGETILTCINDLNERSKIKGIYSLFIRTGKQEQKISRSNFPLFTINDQYTYNQCSLNELECPFYKTFKETIYQRQYRSEHYK